MLPIRPNDLSKVSITYARFHILTERWLALYARSTRAIERVCEITRIGFVRSREDGRRVSPTRDCKQNEHVARCDYRLDSLVFWSGRQLPVDINSYGRAF